jgi:hypothetical protein
MNHPLFSQGEATELSQMMRSPVFMKALHLVAQQGLPEAFSFSDTSLRSLALRQAYLAGYHDFGRTLSRLALFNSEAAEHDDEEAWSYIGSGSDNN